MDQANHIEVSDHIDIKDYIVARSRMLYSLQHIQSAALFARQSFHLEAEYDGTFSDALITNHRSYVTGAIFASVSFLEASINELFSDTVDDSSSEVASQLDPETHDLMADMWKLGIPKTSRYSVMEKYKTAITLARKEPLDFGKSPCQDAQILVNMRNVLVHFEPSWVTTSTDDPLADDSKFFFLRSANKFSFNPIFAGKLNPFFPDKCLSHGCAAWAVKSSMQFIEEFSARMGIPVLFDFLRNRLRTEP